VAVLPPILAVGEALPDGGVVGNMDGGLVATGARTGAGVGCGVSVELPHRG